MGVLSVWHWLLVVFVGTLAAPSPVSDAMSALMAALSRVAAMPRAEQVLDYRPDFPEGLVLFRLPGDACFLKPRSAIQQLWIRRDDQKRIEITILAPLGSPFDFAGGQAALEVVDAPASYRAEVPVASTGAPVWRFTLEDTPELRATLDRADENFLPATMHFTALRDGKPAGEPLTIGISGLVEGLGGLDSCGSGAEPPGLVGP